MLDFEILKERIAKSQMNVKSAKDLWDETA